MLLATLGLTLLSLAMGRYGIPFSELGHILAGKALGWTPAWPATMETVIFNVRLPRIAAALAVGAALAVAGSAYQALFRNPMVSPDILGASSGAGFGAALAILLSLPFGLVQFSSFAFGLGAVGLTWLVAALVARGNSATLVLVLTGMVVSALFAAFISLTKFVADPYSKLPAITFWLMGGLGAIGPGELFAALVPMVLGLLPLAAVRWRLNVLAFGDEEARSMGIDTTRLRLVVIVCSTLLTSAAVSVAGMVGWVGLVIPHLARMVVGPDCRVLLPASLLIGAAFMLGVDDIARCAFAMELPLGILTALVGAPFFVFLLLRGRKGWL
jgi:iron complex transport system permease protein